MSVSGNGSGRLPAEDTRKSGFLAELPLVVWLVVVWGALWQDFSLGNLVFGLILAVLVVKTLRLPPVRHSGRFNVLYALEFVVKFVWWVALGSLEVFWLAVRPGPRPTNAVVSVRLRTTDDLLMTVVGQVVSLIPGSLVVEVDRRSATVYFHVIDISSKRDAKKFRDRVFEVEELIIRVMGKKDYLEALREDRLDELPDRETADMKVHEYQDESEPAKGGPA